MTTLVEVKIDGTPFVFRFHPTWHKWLEEAGLLGTQFIKKMEVLWLEMKDRGEVMRPHHSRWFAAFEDDPEQIRVVILGQDPYPTPHRATGYSFEIHGDVEDSLHTIYAAIRAQCPRARIDSKRGDLSHWRNQGIFLLNAALSVCASRERPATIKGESVMVNKPRTIFGMWAYFTKGAVRVLCEKRGYLVFVLWGRLASNFRNLKRAPITVNHDCVMSYHPSELAKTVKKPIDPPLKLFQDVPHFKQVNALLAKRNSPPIDWSNLPPP